MAWGDRLAYTGLPKRHRAALDIVSSWFGGSVSAPDLFVASIRRSTMRDLVEAGYARKRLIGWELTLKAWQMLNGS